MSLATKLAEVYLEVDRFAKSKAVTGSGPSFKYTPVEEIADKLREAMGKRGVVMVPASCEVVCSEDAGTTKSGTTRWRHVINMTWTLTDGEDSLTVSSVGESMDTGDKGMNKAQTAARKYALIGAFQLSTGDDPDRSHPEPATPRVDVNALAADLAQVVGKDGMQELGKQLKAQGLKRSDFADSAKWSKARSIAEGIAALNQGNGDGRREPDDPAPEPAPVGQGQLGQGL